MYMDMIFYAFLKILNRTFQKQRQSHCLTHLLVFLVITFDILVSIRGVPIRGVTESGDDQYDFHCLYIL